MESDGQQPAKGDRGAERRPRERDSELSRNQETDEKPSTISERGVSATRPWRANVRANASVMAPSSQPLSPMSRQTESKAAN